MKKIFLILILTIQLTALLADWLDNENKRYDDEDPSEFNSGIAEDGDPYEISNYNSRQVFARRDEIKTICCDDICCRIREEPPSYYYYYVNNKITDIVMNATCVNCWMLHRPKILISNESHITRKRFEKKEGNTYEEYNLHRGCKACRC